MHLIIGSGHSLPAHSRLHILIQRTPRHGRDDPGLIPVDILDSCRHSCERTFMKIRSLIMFQPQELITFTTSNARCLSAAANTIRRGPNNPMVALRLADSI